VGLAAASAAGQIEDGKRMSDKKSLLSGGWGMVGRNKRYIFWFWLLNLTLAEFGTAAFRKSAHAILDHSMAADRLLHGFDLAVMINLLARPEFGPLSAARIPTLYFSFLFLVFTVLFLPGVFQGYASTYRLSREDFFRACGRNLWRYIRLMIVVGIVMLVARIALFPLHDVLERVAGESTNELLLPELRFAGLFVIFLIMTVFRIWFDLAEVDVVLSDQRAVRKSIGTAFLHTFRSPVRLLASYLVTALVAAIILLGGIWTWMKFVAPENWFTALLLSQLMLFLLLIPRFWQRGVAVSYWKQNMMAPVVALQPIMPPTITPPIPVAVAPDPAPVPNPPPTRQRS
jgi:NADH:ubiquinone oxidoreductase subunit 6 (subunit J)